MWPDFSHDPAVLSAFAPRIVGEWSAGDSQRGHRRMPGTMVFADISGFTRLTERLARRGRVGAELLSDALDLTFATLLAPAFSDGADLLKWGGDAVLLFFRGEHHAVRAARAAHRMRAALRELMHGESFPVPAQLRMSIGVHSGEFDLYLVGDPASHLELIVGGPDITRLVDVEQVCGAGQILLSDETAALLSTRVLGETREIYGGAPGRMLRSAPTAPDLLVQDVAAPARPVLPTVSVAMAVPPGIRAHVESGPSEPEHRPVTIGFVQFTGLDALSPQEATEAVDALVIAVQRACLRHGVTFFESDIAADGGKIMLTAGAPRSAGRDAERMLAAGREIADHSGALTVRVGVSSGHVFAGELGPAVRRAYSIKGDAVNLAARLLGHTGPAQLVATAAVVGEVHAAVEASALAPFAVKGKRDPVHAVIVRQVRAHAAGMSAETRFIGRADELAQLRAAIAAASEHRGSVVDIVGEPGIGKTRLVAEAEVPPGMRTVATGVSGYDAGATYATIGGLMRAVLGLAAHDEAEVVAHRLEQTVHDLRPDLLIWLALLAVPLGLDLPPSREVQELDPRFRRGRIEEVVLSLLAELLSTPTLLIFEDTHLLDEASGSLLHHLEGAAEDLPWCMIITRREVPIGHVPSLDAPADRRMRIAGMPHDLALALVVESVGPVRASRHALEAMVERGGGNPLFLTSLAASAGALGAGGSIDQLPGSVEAVLLVDIDRLATGDRALLRLAAVLGMRFDPRFLTQLDDGQSRMPEADVAVRLEEFLRPTDDGDLEFRHAMVREVAYEGLPFRLRRRLHERVALALVAATDRTVGSDLLSLHFHAAGLHEQAWTHSLAAGEEARRKYAYAQAAVFFARALDTAAHLPQISHGRRADASSSLGDCLDMAGDATGALTALRRARRDLGDDPIATAELLSKESRITQRLGRYRLALSQLTRGLRLLEGVEGARADAVRAQLATRYGFGLHLQSRASDAVRWGRRGVEWAQASGDQTALAQACNALHLAYGASAQAEDRPYGQLALGLYERLDDLTGQALTLNNLAIDAYNSGAWTDAIDAFERTSDAFRRLGDEANEATALYNRADVLVAQGRHAEALPVLEIALRLARRADDEELVGLVLREQARAEAGSGDRVGAWPLFDEAREVLAGLELTTEVALLDAARAEALTAEGDSAEALTLIDETILAAQAKAADTLARLHRIRAQVLVNQGQADRAADAARDGLARTTGGFGGYEPALLRLALAEATDDELLRAESRQVLHSLGVVA
ncbi:adenylate/guanylate cyclase domain-containing protein [Microbacterium sp. H1-D42]|uniref:adenylate/guanylate cyclase domain-containing protein n=1 Tax=Microbacterium sp. H1-D42 TaxID=2925844 RepID=UPI001F52D2CB|nr:adenylate/guanylate cyclase domain-containing protein [Microbacterium sp. H1-D42]UNK71483.1 tetratricopeptide repeat protein [Microbacterium sp. H1-D42]